MLKAIVFDFDGVIVDSEPLHYRAFLRVAEGFGIHFNYEQYVQRYVGYDDRDAFRVMLSGKDTPDDAIGVADEREVARCCTEKAAAFEAVVNEGVEPIPGALALVDAAGASMPLAISSGATRQDIDLILDRLSLNGRFEVIVSADDVARSKPDPASYAMAVRLLSQRHPEFDIEPSACLSIEDTAAGVASARAAGLMTLGLATTISRDALASAHRVVETLEGVDVDRLEQWFG